MTQKVKKQRLSDEDRIKLSMKISHRHREWGWDVPAVDIDFLLVEYDAGIPRALIEYKHELATIQRSGHSSYRALKWLCDGVKLPFFAVRWADDFSWFRVIPLNKHADKIITDTKEFTEEQYVEFLYSIRNRKK